ncbi:hypothetical protein K439DRAFT_987349 [Ramaria rubella]|nr:hypothetical protein K439DRAFT_987349 [Ramaria rubella]
MRFFTIASLLVSTAHIALSAPIDSVAHRAQDGGGVVMIPIPRSNAVVQRDDNEEQDLLVRELLARERFSDGPHVLFTRMWSFGKKSTAAPLTSRTEAPPKPPPNKLRKPPPNKLWKPPNKLRKPKPSQPSNPSGGTSTTSRLTRLFRPKSSNALNRQNTRVNTAAVNHGDTSTHGNEVVPSTHGIEAAPLPQMNEASRVQTSDDERAEVQRAQNVERLRKIPQQSNPNLRKNFRSGLRLLSSSKNLKTPSTGTVP